MIAAPGDRTRRILIGVTIDDSLQFHTGLPAALVRDGWEVHVVSGPGRRNDALSAEPGVTAHVIPMARGPHPARDLVALVRWWVLLRSVRPDVTLIGTPKAALLGHLAGRVLGVPRRIYNLLGLRVETSTGVLRRILLAMERTTSSSATEVLSVSRSVESLALQLGLFARDRSRVLGLGSCNGVAVARYRELASDTRAAEALALSSGLTRGLPVVGFVGRLTRDKGLPELADALTRLAHDGGAVQLLIVGGVDDPSGQAAMQRLRATGQRIVAVGYQPDPAPYYAVMDVFCLPSLREGLPNVLLEAMASGTVVVASDATGNVDLIHDGETGYLVPRHSGGQLADGLTRALRDARAESRITRSALQLVTEQFDVEDVQARIRSYLLGGEQHLGERTRHEAE